MEKPKCSKCPVYEWCAYSFGEGEEAPCDTLNDNELTCLKEIRRCSCGKIPKLYAKRRENATWYFIKCSCVNKQFGSYNDIGRCIEEWNNNWDESYRFPYKKYASKDEEAISVKTCPFCGGKAVFKLLNIIKDEEERNVKFIFKPVCSKCGASFSEQYNASVTFTETGVFKVNRNGINDAVKKWNTRGDNSES